MLIILLDDVGFGQAETFGGEVHTPTLSKLADQGISYNTFHTTVDLLADPRGAPDRAQPPARRLRHDRRARGRLGRLYRRHPEELRHHRRGAAALRLQDRGLRQVAQHARRPDHRDGAVGPLAERLRLRLFLRLPRRRDLAVGAAADREHQRGRAAARREIPPDRGPCDSAASTGCDGIGPSPRTSRSFMYWAPGAVHGPHHIFKEWADKYKGKFDNGWDAYRERVFARQKQLGWIPADTKLTPRADIDGVLGQHSRGAAPVPAAADGDLRRLRRARRRRRSAG